MSERFLCLLLQIGANVGCPISNTTVLADCLRASSPKALTLAYHLELVNPPGKAPGPSLWSSTHLGLTRAGMGH